MINKIFLNLLSIFLSLVDYTNKIKVIRFFKRNFGENNLNVIDIGSHEGETIDYLLKNFNIKKIFSFEPNVNLYNYLKKKTRFNNEKVNLYNCGVGLKKEILQLNVMIDSASSTFNKINSNNRYYKRKNKIITLLSSKKDLIEKRQEVLVENLSDIILKNRIDQIDILKIDTEGFEFNILKGVKDIDFKKIKFIYFEHHYDLMIKKGYNFSDINDLLIKKNFQKKFKLKMKFRKSFEYIYENKN